MLTLNIYPIIQRAGDITMLVILLDILDQGCCMRHRKPSSSPAASNVWSRRDSSNLYHV